MWPCVFDNFAAAESPGTRVIETVCRHGLAGPRSHTRSRLQPWPGRPQPLLAACSHGLAAQSPCWPATAPARPRSSASPTSRFPKLMFSSAHTARSQSQSLFSRASSISPSVAYDNDPPSFPCPLDVGTITIMLVRFNYGGLSPRSGNGTVGWLAAARR
jgi:hypothetical protein